MFVIYLIVYVFAMHIYGSNRVGFLVGGGDDINVLPKKGSRVLLKGMSFTELQVCTNCPQFYFCIFQPICFLSIFY